jgi:spoIIIJ-associated protein
METEKKKETEIARSALERLLDLMEIKADVVPVEEAPPDESPDEEAPLGNAADTTSVISFDVQGDDLGILIGRRGQTLASLQYIVRLIVGHQAQVWLPIVIDIEGYKKRRNESLQALAWRAAEQVKAQRMPFALEPMPAFDRRIIHLTLADHLDVTTQSSGEGESRRVVIIPKEQFR